MQMFCVYCDFPYGPVWKVIQVVFLMWKNFSWLKFFELYYFLYAYIQLSKNDIIITKLILHLVNPVKPEFTIVIFIQYKPRIAVAILDL